jgi:hypothetical protein
MADALGVGRENRLLSRMEIELTWKLSLPGYRRREMPSMLLRAVAVISLIGIGIHPVSARLITPLPQPVMAQPAPPPTILPDIEVLNQGLLPAVSVANGLAWATGPAVYPFSATELCGGW